MADFQAFDRTTEDKDMAREGLAASGNPTRGGSVLDVLRTKFAKLDETRIKVFPVSARNGERFWLELVRDVTEDEMDQFRERADRASRADRRAGRTDVSNALLAGNIISEKNTRMWATDPLDEDGELRPEAEPILDEDGDPLTVHSEPWCEALGYPRDPVGGLRHLFGDFPLIGLYLTYTESISEVDPTQG